MALVTAGLLPALASAAPPGALITNRATLSAADLPAVQAAVSVKLSAVSFLRYAPPPAAPAAAMVHAAAAASLLVQPVLCGGDLLALPSFAVPGPGSLPALPASYSLDAATEFQVGEPVFLQVSDTSSNLSSGAQDLLTVSVINPGTGDSETLQLLETAANSGDFVGFLNTTRASAASDCLLTVRGGDRIHAVYGSERSDEAALVDPYGVVFDAGTGALLDGASVTLIDDTTDAPATVLGEDGEPYPNPVVSGSSFTTATRSYALRPGEYRFPFVTPGRRYRLEVSHANHVFPTGRANSDFAAPAFAGLVVTTGSRGEPFTLPSGLPLRIDLPLDPVGSGLLLVKNALRTVVAIGDFVPYDIVASNRSGGALTALQLQDTLPPGFRYRAGSLKRDGVVQPDPAISADGRTLTVALGDIADDADVRLSYVAEPSAATPLGDAVNSAVAGNAVLQSNIARATVRVREELMRSRALLMGRVLETNSCDAADLAQARPLSGARIYLEDGRYVISDARGRWHFDDIKPGTHVVQLDEQGLPKGAEILPCENNGRAAGTVFSRFVDVQGGTLWQVDFFVQRASPLHLRMDELQRRFALRLTSEVISGGLRYTLSFNHPDTRIDEAALQVLLPRDLKFVPGSLQLDGVTRPDPVLDDKGWRLPLPELVAAGAEGGHALSWEVALGEGARPGHHAVHALIEAKSGGQALEPDILENQASVVVPERLGKVIIFRPRFATFSTTLTPADRRWLDGILDELRDAGDIRLEIVGHTDNVPVVPRKGRLINDNHALSQARAQSVADYLKKKLSLAGDRIQAIGRGPDEPMADNTTPKGRDTNRRVELKVFALSRAEGPRLEVQRGDSGEHLKAWAEWQSVPVRETAPANNQADAAAPADEAQGLLSHRDGEVVADRVQALRVRVDARLKAEILLDGKPIPEDRLGFRKNEGQTVLMSYVGVDLGEAGPHELRVRGSDGFGIARLDQKVTVVVASDITRIRAAQSPENVADGRTPLSVRIELVDASGRVVPAAVDVRLLDSAGLRPFVSSDAQRAVAQSAGKIPVGTDGVMKFAPVTRSGLYTLELAYNNAVEKIPVYVRPEKREWILVALAEGSLAAKRIKGNMQSAQAAGADDSLWQDGRTAFFAKGQIQGKWLLTLAYDSSREKAGTFGGAISPERFYTLYADASDPNYDAPSQEKLYLRIEKDAFYALFGDFTTGMTEVELARYNRSFTGLKSEYHDQRFDVNVFAADSGRGFVKDEMRGDGTSGLYKLSRRTLLAGSDKVRIEVRDRFRSEVVLSSQQLARWADYNIDYDRGELFFKTPVPSQDGSFNPVWIVVEYEAGADDGSALNAGGRAAVKFDGGRAVLGLSAVSEQYGINKGRLAALDSSYKLTPRDTLRLEVANSAVDGILPRDGSAELLEWKHDSEKIKGRAYLREQEGGFGLGQQSATEEGTRKLGVEGRYQLRQHMALTADIFQQDMLTSGSSRQVLDVRNEVSHDRYGYGVGLRHVTEDRGAAGQGSADQLTLSGRYNLPGNKVKLRSTLELGLAGNSESMDFPDRFLLGADYQIHRKVQLSLEQEWALSAERNTENTRFGVLVQPWQGARIGTHLDRESAESGERLRAGLGLGQNLTLTPAWTADVGYDRAETLKNSQTLPFNPALPATFGPAGADFWAASAGANYRHEDIKGVGRIERREAKDEKRWNLVGGLYRELNPEVAVALGLTAALAERRGGDIEDNLLLRGSFAWRPDDGPWIVLDRLDLGIDRRRSATADYKGQRLVNNLNASRRWQANQLSLQYGAKFVFDTVDDRRYSGYTDLIGVEWRRDLDARWDIGWQSSLLHSWQPGILDYSYGPSVGMTPAKNVWVSLGFNFQGFTDADFSAGEYSADGLYLKLRLKLDQHSVRQIWNDARGVFGQAGQSMATTDVQPAPAAVEAVSAPAAPATSAGTDWLEELAGEAAAAPAPVAPPAPAEAPVSRIQELIRAIPGESVEAPTADVPPAAAPSAPLTPPVPAAGGTGTDWLDNLAGEAVTAPAPAAPLAPPPAPTSRIMEMIRAIPGEGSEAPVVIDAVPSAVIAPVLAPAAPAASSAETDWLDNLAGEAVTAPAPTPPVAPPSSPESRIRELIRAIPGETAETPAASEPVPSQPLPAEPVPAAPAGASKSGEDAWLDELAGEAVAAPAPTEPAAAPSAPVSRIQALIRAMPDPDAAATAPEPSITRRKADGARTSATRPAATAVKPAAPVAPAAGSARALSREERLEAHRAMVKRRQEQQQRRERLERNTKTLQKKLGVEEPKPAAEAPRKKSQMELEAERRYQRKQRRERLRQRKEKVEEVLQSAQQ